MLGPIADNQEVLHMKHHCSVHGMALALATADTGGNGHSSLPLDGFWSEYLNGTTDQWQTSQAWALDVVDNSITGFGFVGLGRPASDTGTVYFDNFSVQTPSTDQTFDATTVGANTLPDNWTAYKSNTNDAVGVADPTTPAPPSGTNALAITAAESGDVDQAWLKTSLSANLSVSVDTYLDTLTPDVVFARGSELGTTSSNYYALEVTRGYLTASLVKVVDGTQTVLDTDSVTESQYYVPDVWVQETLELNGDTLSAIVYRTDTDQYLTSNGEWQSAWTTAMTVTDSSITGGGEAGVGRPVGGPLYQETQYYDDFTTAPGMDTQTFAMTPPSPPSPPSLPSSTGWTQASSNGTNNNFSVGTGPDTTSTVLVSAGLASTITAAAWDTNSNDQLTNAQVTATVYVSALMPTLQVVARGQNLGTTTASYYGLSVLGGENGLTVNLVRVNDGDTTQLFQYEFPNESKSDLVTYNYVNTWIQETLYVDGDNIRATLYRTDTGQYLNTEGEWQTLPTCAINVIDPDPLTNAGDAGIVRPTGSAAYTGYVDDFAVNPVSVDPTPPSVTLSAPSGTLSGTVTVTATPTQTVPTADYAIDKVEFYVEVPNGSPVLNAVVTGAPYTWSLNTSSLSNGTHTLLVKVYDDEGNVGEGTTTITTSNDTTLSMPSDYPPHSDSSVGIVELDYASDAADSTLVQNYVDTVIGEVGTELTTIHNWDSSVQQLFYTNLSNLGASLGDASNLSQDGLLAWLNYAEQNASSVNAEAAFYHVAVATPYSGAGHSSIPVDEFWAVFDPNDETNNEYSEAYGGGSISFGSSVNQAVDIGYLEPFWEINLNLSTAAGSGWTYALEYPTAVDGSGNPTAWGTITPLTDTTDGFTQTGQGQITFNAPSTSTWVPASIDGSAMMYFVRIVTETAGTAPVAHTITGDNYTQSPAGTGSSSGIIPTYDWALDSSGGYLDPSQYAIAVAAGDTAHFGYQSRLFYDGPMRFYTNPSNPEFDAWAISYNLSFLNPNSALYQQYATGLFVDNSIGNPPGQGTGAIEGYNIQGSNSTYQMALVELTDTYSNDYATLLNAIGLELAPDNGWILANTFGSGNLPGGKAGQTYADPIIQKVQGYYDEQSLLAAADDTSAFLSLYSQVYYRATYDDPEYAVMDSKSTGGPSPNPEQDPQTQLTTLAAYYILAPNTPSQGALDFFGGESTSSAWEPSTGTYNHWSPAAAYNIGTPDSSLPPTPDVFTTGKESDQSTYVVYDRKFSGQNGEPVLVLYKPLSTSGATGSSTATTVNLGGSYYVLQTNGTLSSTTVTSISLENGEGAILVDPPTSPPTMVRTATSAGSFASSPAAVMPATQTPADTNSVTLSSPGSTTSKLAKAEFYNALFPGLFVPNEPAASQSPIPQSADPFASWTNQQHLFSAGLSAKLLKSHGNSTSFEKILGSADDDFAALFSVSPEEQPPNSSPAS